MMTYIEQVYRKAQSPTSHIVCWWFIAVWGENVHPSVTVSLVNTAGLLCAQSAGPRRAVPGSRPPPGGHACNSWPLLLEGELIPYTSCHMYSSSIEVESYVNEMTWVQSWTAVYQSHYKTVHFLVLNMKKENSSIPPLSSLVENEMCVDQLE